jgi:hypothetical protein
VRNDGSFQFRELVLSSRTPKGQNAGRWALKQKWKRIRMKMTSKSASNHFALLVLVLSIGSMVSCTSLSPIRPPSVLSTDTIRTVLTTIPTIISVVKLTPAPTKSSTYQELLDAKVRHPTSTPIITATASLTPTSTPKYFPTNPELYATLDARTRDFYHQPASAVFDFLLEIQDAVRTDNKEKLASLVLYPTTIIDFEGKTNKDIHNSEEFIANYEKIATPKWKEVILAQDPFTLFTNWKGIMVHRGELWFTSVCLDTTCQDTKLYIVTINEDTDW